MVTYKIHLKNNYESAYLSLLICIQVYCFHKSFLALLNAAEAGFLSRYFLLCVH